MKGAELGAASAAKTLKEAGGSLVDADTEANMSLLYSLGCCPSKA